VVDLAWAPDSPHHLASASHDGTVKVWDSRSTVPLATLSHHKDKALCVAWLGPLASGLLASGGADAKLLSYRSGNAAGAVVQ
jgi:ribosome biogenesis protein YTM1